VTELIALEATGTRATVDRIERIWDDGDAVLPIDPRLPIVAAEALLDAMAPAAFIDRAGHRHPRSARPAVPLLDGDALVVATSGSTGVPKGVIHTHVSIAASALATNLGIGTQPDADIWLCSLPLAHVAGLSVVFRARAAGVPLLLLDGFDAHTCTAAAVHDGATLTTLVPTALARIDPAIFRRIVVGGTHPPNPLPPNCVVSYGLTETGSAITYDGFPLHGASVKVVGGTIRLSGPMLLRAYRTNTPEGHDPRGPDGFFDTADAGELKPDGQLLVHGRTGDMIITGGENVWPITVEQVVARFPGVAEVAVVGRPDDHWGQVVTAVIVPAVVGGLDAERDLPALRSFAKQHLPGYAVPQRIEVRSSLPATALGKVLRSAL